MENVATKHGLGSTWRVQCKNESCSSHKTNSVFNSSEKSIAFEITVPQFLAFEQSVVGIRRLQSFLVSLAWRRLTKTPGGSYKKDRRRGKTFVRERIKPCFSWCKRVEVFQRRIKLFTCLPRKFVTVTCYLSKSYC